MLPKPLSYNKFVFSECDKFNKETNNNTGGFNLSSGTKPFYVNDRFFNLFCLRYYTIKSTVYDREIIPGNMKCNINILSEHETIKSFRTSFNSEYKDISIEDYGKNYVWNNWIDSNINQYSIIFIGEITPENTIIEHDIIYYLIYKLFDDSRILYIKSIENELNIIYIYVIFPRCLVGKDTKYYYYFITYNINDKNNIEFEYIISSEYTNIYDNKVKKLTSKSINTECYKYEIITDNDNTDSNSNYDTNIIIFYFFNWYEDRCITQFKVSSQLFTDNYIKNIFKNSIVNTTPKKKYKISELYDHYNLIPCELTINNKYLNGDISQEVKTIDMGSIKKKFYRVINMEMSFGTPFINSGGGGDLIAVGHGKLFSNKNMFLYDSVKLNKIQDLVPKILRKIFGDKYKQHHGTFDPPCILGYNYFSYFIKYNENLKTYCISDFFITIDFSDKYHFSLIFTVGIFNIGNNTFITSGEGDYYNSIIKYKTNDILCSCVHNVLDINFNFENINFYIHIKNLDGTIENLLIDDSLDINNIICNYKNKNKYKNKYLKYKQKYLIQKKL